MTDRSARERSIRRLTVARDLALAAMLVLPAAVVIFFAVRAIL